MACKKCGGTKITANHIKDGQLINSSSFKKIDNEFIRSSEYDYFYKLTANKEHLLKSCPTCSYSWRESTLDNTQK